MIQRVREPFNAWSHLVGAGFSLAGAIWLLSRSSGHGIECVGFATYGLALTALFLASGLYHALPESKWLQRVDHAAIYVMIAGSYTPVTLLAIRGSVGFTMFAIEWTMAALGVVATFAFGGGPKGLRLVLYLVMGWMAVLALGRVQAAIGASGTLWMLMGGTLYTVGSVVYAAKRPRLWPGRFGSHELWHCFVLGGAAAHFAMMIRILETR